LRITGAEIEKGHRRNGWSVADDAMLQRIARSSMTELAAFLASPAVPPGAPAPAPAQIALIGDSDVTPEEAGIFRIFRPQADPKPAAESEPASNRQSAVVPLPHSRPASPAAVSARETLTLAASGRTDGR
jgi:hypothetical protein